MTDKSILIAVARADVIICAALRVLAVAALALILLLVVLAGRKIADPCRQNYYGPCDITSEGPDSEVGDYE